MNASNKQWIINIFLNYPFFISLSPLKEPANLIKIWMNHDSPATIRILTRLTNPDLPLTLRFWIISRCILIIKRSELFILHHLRISFNVDCYWQHFSKRSKRIFTFTFFNSVSVIIEVLHCGYKICFICQQMISFDFSIDLASV